MSVPHLLIAVQLLGCLKDTLQATLGSGSRLENLGKLRGKTKHIPADRNNKKIIPYNFQRIVMTV